jgi:hypothetical protein
MVFDAASLPRFNLILTVNKQFMNHPGMPSSRLSHSMGKSFIPQSATMGGNQFYLAIRSNDWI